MRWLVLLLLLPGIAAAQAPARLTMALQSDLAALDPHVAPAQTKEATLRHVYDALVDRDAELRIVPGLAAAWRRLGDTTWEFTLRPGVRFSDGNALRAQDVAFSLARAAGVRSSAGTYAPYVRAIRSVAVTEPDTVRIETNGPYPQLLGDLCRIAIVSEALAAQAGTDAFNRGTAAIGTGPYAALGWAPGEALRLTRNPQYWGNRPAWDEVAIRPVANDAARLAALMSGEADVIDKVPMTDLARLRADPAFRLAVHDGNRSMFLAPNFAEGAGRYATDAAGAPLPHDPLRSPQVRRAMALAINRPALVERVMAGLGSAAEQVVPPGMFGHDPTIPPVPFDPDGARRLLTEAGYPQGFRLVLHCSAGRYVNDAQTCQAAAQMLSRVGIRTEVQAEPQAIFYARLNRGDFDLVLNGWGSDTGDSIVVLRQALHAPQPGAGLGGFNRGSYASPAVDTLIETATGTTADTAREALQRQAMHLAMEDGALIPLYTSAWVWGTRRAVAYHGGFEEGTLAMRASPAP